MSNIYDDAKDVALTISQYSEADKLVLYDQIVQVLKSGITVDNDYLLFLLQEMGRPEPRSDSEIDIKTALCRRLDIMY